MGYVHFCVFCGFNRAARTETMLEPSCTSCGCPLRSCEEAAFPSIAKSLADQRQPKSPRFDGAGPLAAMCTIPFLLPIVGVEIRDVIFAVPLLFLVFASVLCAGAAKRPEEPSGPWLAYSAAAAIVSVAIGLAIVLSIADVSLKPPFYIGSVASAVFVGGLWVHLRPRLSWAQPDKLLEVSQLLVLVVAAVVYFAVVPGVTDGDPVISLAVGLDLVTFILAGLLVAASRRGQDVRVAKRLAVMTFLFLTADSLALAHAAGRVGDVEEIVAALMAVGGWFLANAAVSERPGATVADARDPDVQPEWKWFVARAGLPSAQVLAFPLVFAWAIAVDGAGVWPIAWFGGALTLVVMAAFARQTYLIIDHRRAVIEERGARRSAQRRNQELEALTGLATTMTQTLEEAPIVEQALTVLHTAARATSSALHVIDDEGKRKLRAAAGDWQSEHPWADRMWESVDEVQRFVRGGRQLTRIALAARGHDIGWVTLVRPASDPLGDRELDLLRLLVDQMAIAVQNARDYREKLEQAIRDPLTGVYNRRYFFEALEKEVQRSRRYGSNAALVLLDVDDFKKINDSRGHAVGDAVLRSIVSVVEPLLRPVDSFARIGGEEFALLLPETEQLDALLVAERLRAAISRAQMVPGLKVTVSGGVGSCPQDAPTREELVRRTDAALYWAKRNGKDLCAVVNETTDGMGEYAPDADHEAAVAHLTTLVAAIDAEHLHTRDHSENVAQYAMALGQAAGLDRDHLVMLRRAALLHDVGKVAVRADVLDKPSGLTDEEFAEIKLHSNVGAAMLHHAGLVEESAWVRHHHERVDGRGYPDALTGEQIPLESRILFVADSFEAMTSDRPYRTGMPVEAALAELRRCAGTQFESRLVELFCRIVERGELRIMALRSDAAAS